MGKSINFQVAFGAVRHFGRNLYTTNPPAITELVANSWDAYATSCYIFQYRNGLMIVDNGIGMNFDELNNNYATSGNVKKTENVRIPQSMLSKHRKYMGRKGIGKFAAFSLGDHYQIVTKSADCKNWLHIELTYDMLNIQEPVVPVSVNEYSTLSDVGPDFREALSDLPDFTSGTVIYIPLLTREFTQATFKSLTNSLPRRFSSIIMDEDVDFDLFIEDKSVPVDLKEHFYYQKIENMYIFGFEKTEHESFFNKFKILQENGKNIIEDDEYFKEKSIRGWIGTVSTTSDLVVDDVEISGVAIYINGKIADTNVFRELNDASVPNTYLVGAVDADFLQSDEVDPVLSSREGLNYELDNVKELRTELLKIKRKTINSWNDFRNKRVEKSQVYLTEILKNDEYREIYNNYGDEKKSDFRRISQKVFDGENKNLDLIDVFTPALFAMVNDKVLQSRVSSKVSKSDKDIVDIIAEFFETTEINYALRIKANFQNRLDVIKLLEDYREQGAIEKAFQLHLFNNPWLINPTWDVVKRDRVEAEKRYSYLNINNENQDGRVDIIITPKEETNPVIIELKREKKTSYSSPDVMQIMAQIKGYRDAIYQNTVGIDENQIIKAYFICGTEAYSKLSLGDRNFLDINNIIIETFDSLIEKAKSIYEGVNSSMI